MDIEHIGYQVQDPVAMARWYVENLGMRVVRRFGEPAFAQFVADASGHVMIEIYHNPKVKVPDYRSTDPLILHLAFESRDVDGDVKRLLAAGATPEGDIVRAPNGDVIGIVRDPWGFCVQLAKRGKPMI